MSIKTQIKSWNEDRKRRTDMLLFMRLYKDPKSTMQGILNEAAFKMAREMFMRMLDSEGFAHCKLCPNRGPLKKLAETNTMFCPAHYQKAMESYSINHPTPTQEESNAH